jgi:putative flavoprotein involved in K+ transport
VETTETVVIGAGHAGLAVSRCLAESSIDHLVLERADAAHAWRAERWDSLRLLTPNRMTRLPGFSYRGSDPDGFMRAAEVAAFVTAYASAIGAPMRPYTEVLRVSTVDDGFVVDTSQGPIGCRSVVVAVGACGTPRVPAVAGELPAGVTQIAPTRYRRPDDVPDGRVLVVGASASGAQLADELARSGRDVTLAVGHHTRLPRTYRGRDIHAWMDALGLLDQRDDEVDDLAKARRWPSLQLVGSPERRNLDLSALQAAGVEMVGRLVGVRDGIALFSGSLANLVADADLKMARILDQVDALVGGRGERPEPVHVSAPRTAARLAGFSAVVWATGFRPNHPYLEPDLLDETGEIVHAGGAMRRPGMYVIGLPFMRTRKSGFIDGAAADAQAIVDHVRGRGTRTTVARARDRMLVQPRSRCSSG